MFEFLLYSNIACVDAIEIIERINAHEHMDAAVKVELIEVVQEATPDCPWDAHD
ncbi:hypothetical protein CPRG_00106 [Synechococcus phage Syn30]|uniref:Uncharacterized protein n=1 Tax=Synechococcus phage Syn30 TaxID=536474 RepID=M4SLQ9_9CAUD|nr:hypothetical protein CPRG_00106 [Synechococcus phage Syn30]AGH56190.1 hypothetical protein CPRG_00106 [Synechococcus phage Syn30]